MQCSLVSQLDKGTQPVRGSAHPACSFPCSSVRPQSAAGIRAQAGFMSDVSQHVRDPAVALEMFIHVFFGLSKSLAAFIRG